MKNQFNNLAQDDHVYMYFSWEDAERTGTAKIATIPDIHNGGTKQVIYTFATTNPGSFFPGKDADMVWSGKKDLMQEAGTIETASLPAKQPDPRSNSGRMKTPTLG